MAEEREVIVTNDGGGSGAGMIIALVLLVALLIVGFLLYQNGVFSGAANPTDIKADINVNPPATNN